MKARGFVGEPITVVRLENGTLVTLDNTRVLAARRAGVKVQAVVRDASEALPADQVGRFTTRRGGTPQTFGDAVRNRIGNQNAAFRNANPNGSNVTGSVE